jgi:homoserine O-acetyltransferase
VQWAGAIGMKRRTRCFCYPVLLIFLLVATFGNAQTASPAASQFTPQEGEYTLKDFHFKSGETLPELRMHYMALGKPVHDTNGRVTNAVLLLHGTGGSGRQFLAPQFADELFGPGQLLDINRYYIIMVDNVGHGKSSKPSDGMHARFPQYDYDDMVRAQYDLLTEGMGVNHLRLILGTSMGCMHSWVWGETYPGFMDAVMPLACLPVELAGRNRLWRKMVIEGTKQDPDWKNGDYTIEPRAAVQIDVDFLLIAGSAPMLMQKELPTREQTDQYFDDNLKRRAATLDANDFLYAVSASRNYDPSAKLGTITAPVMFVNSADDFINPPELGIAQQEIKKVKQGKFVLIPASEQTHGHGTHTWAVFWQQYLQELLEESK